MLRYVTNRYLGLWEADWDVERLRRRIAYRALIPERVYRCEWWCAQAVDVGLANTVSSWPISIGAKRESDTSAQI